ncbi:tRNA-modifying protein YgfZ [Alteromonas lipotrueiana]|uniref:tRNA-modifying protein YgfZ n=1 Tax=Alteromonas lipotrueiana TaxID=2803815 RepID=UPI001C47EB16|nr:tRNA-modifying protein YgfZ [Alteromonas lipotrueiana]
MNLPARLSELSEDFIIPLSHYGLLTVGGEDRIKYLQGQLTIDINALSETQARHSAHCDFKGKTWSLQIVTRFQDEILLSIEKSALAMTHAQLNKYGVFSKVNIEDASDQYSQVAVGGHKVLNWLKEQGLTPPESSMQAQSFDHGVVIKLDYAQEVFLVIAEQSFCQQLVEFSNTTPITQYSHEVFEALSVQNAVPHVTADHSNEYVPQMMNVQALAGIDFSKGCYMGQEVVARTRYLGRNKRAAFAFKTQTALTVSTDAVIEKQLGENWRRGGAVIRHAVLGNETWLLAVINNDTTSDDVFRLAKTEQPTFSIEPLPYSIEDSKK